MAFFLEGFEVQDAPRYGAERRGAPIFAYVRAAKSPILERGIISDPDLVIVADDTLVGVPAAGVLTGLADRTVLLINTVESEATWQHRLNITSTLITLPVKGDVEDRAELPYVGAACAGAAARLVGVIQRDTLANAVTEEIGRHGRHVTERNLEMALEAYDQMEAHAGCVQPAAQATVGEHAAVEWVDFPYEDATVSAPAIHAAATSIEVRTGLWRTMRPVIDYDRCNRCWWVCSESCPDGAISVDDNRYPQIDYDHCKGCMICVAQCPPHAIAGIPEHIAGEKEKQA
jgi:pyruvate ferredoxin oxidoreductase gamma subunit